MVHNAQEAGYDVAIVYSEDYENEKIEKKSSHIITISSVLIG